MSEARSVFGHTAVYAFAAILNRGAGFLLLPVYTHFLDPSDYGVLGVIAITSEVVGAVIGVKLGTAMSRLFFDYAEADERAELVSTTILGLALIVAASSVVLAFIAEPLAGGLLGNRDQGDLLFLGVFGLLLSIIFNVGLQYLVVLQRSKVVLTISTLRSVVYLSLGALFVGSLGMGVFGALLGILLTNALATVGLILLVLVRVGVRFSKAKFSSLVSFGAPLLPGQMGELLIKFSDRYFLVHFLSLASVGVFFLGVRLSAMLQMALIAPFNQIYIVRRFEAHGRGEEDSEAPRVFTYFFTIIVSGALALSVVAPQLIALIAFGKPEYESAASVIPLLALSEVVRSILLVVELGLFYAKKPQSLTYASLATLLFHVPVTAIMIWMYGLLGAAGAVCLSGAFRLVFTWRLARGMNGPRPQWGYLSVILSAAVAVFGLAWAVELALGSFWGGVGRLLLAVTFPVFLLLSPLFRRSEREAVRSFALERLSRAGSTD